MKKWICCFCGTVKQVKNKYSKSGHLARCKKWKQYKKDVLTKEYLESEYIVKGKSAYEIAKEHNLLSAISIIKLLKKYKIATRSISESHKQERMRKKSENTCLKLYGCKSVVNRNSPQVKAYLKREGISNPYQSEKVKQKIKQTMMQKYGVEHPMHVEEFKRKQSETTFKNWGVYHNSQHPEIKKRKVETCLKNYGVPYGGFVSPKSLTKPHRKVILWLNEYKISFKIEQPINVYVVDILIGNKIIEVNGDFWHANPNKYNADDMIPLPGASYLINASDIWDREQKRTNQLIALGYEVLVLWESEIKQSIVAKEIMCKFLKLKP